MKEPIIAPSILSADFYDIGSAIRHVEESGCPWLHLDIMDGHFVPPITFGHKMIADIRAKTELFLDAHLMIEEPERHINAYIESGADAITFHLEACVHSHRLIQSISRACIKAGISIVPSTPVSNIVPLLEFLDLVLVMTVNPGYGGQKLIPFCLQKVEELRRIREQRGLHFLIAIDGGVNAKSISDIVIQQPDVLVIGSAFFNAQDRKQFVADFRNAWTSPIGNID